MNMKEGWLESNENLKKLMINFVIYSPYFCLLFNFKITLQKKIKKI